MRRTKDGATKRCDLHPIQPRPRTRSYNELARAIVVNATHCGLCGEGPRPDDVFVCDHIVPRAAGGASIASNLQAVHRSCNNRKGASVANWPSRWQ
jgi:5-methylcytosine-specific restriction endonuclease McrA